MEGYNLTFFQAIEKCLYDDRYIRGDGFAPGTYAKKKDGVIVVIDASGYTHNYHGDLHISTGLMNQKFKAFAVANKQELELGENI